MGSAVAISKAGVRLRGVKLSHLIHPVNIREGLGMISGEMTIAAVLALPLAVVPVLVAMSYSTPWWVMVALAYLVIGAVAFQGLARVVRPVPFAEPSDRYRHLAASGAVAALISASGAATVHEVLPLHSGETGWLAAALGIAGLVLGITSLITSIAVVVDRIAEPSQRLTTRRAPGRGTVVRGDLPSPRREARLAAQRAKSDY